LTTDELRIAVKRGKDIYTFGVEEIDNAVRVYIYEANISDIQGGYVYGSFGQKIWSSEFFDREGDGIESDSDFFDLDLYDVVKKCIVMMFEEE